MIEDFKGKIITDEDVSLPKMEDYFYNSLTPFLKQDEKDSDSIFYIESPLDGEDAVGMSADGTIFTIKTGPGYNVDSNKSAIRIPDLSIYTGINSAYALKLNSRKCDVGNVAEIHRHIVVGGDAPALECVLVSHGGITGRRSGSDRGRTVFGRGCRDERTVVIVEVDIV